MCRKWVRTSAKRVAMRAFYGGCCPGATVVERGLARQVRAVSPPRPTPVAPPPPTPAASPLSRWDLSLGEVRSITCDGGFSDEPLAPDRPSPFVTVEPPAPAEYEYGLVYDTAMSWARTGLMKRAREDRELAAQRNLRLKQVEAAFGISDILFCTGLEFCGLCLNSLSKSIFGSTLLQTWIKSNS